MAVADLLPGLVPYFRRVAHRMAYGADADDLFAVALECVWAKRIEIEANADPRRRAISAGIFAMRRERSRQRTRAARHALLGDVEPHAEDDRDEFEELIAGPDAHLLRLRYGVGRTLAELAGAEGVTAATMKGMVRRAVGRVGVDFADAFLQNATS